MSGRRGVAIVVLSSLVLGAWSGAAAAQVFEVPGDFPDLPAALAAVPPDAVIVVHGGTHRPIEVTKPVTIVGSPLATIDNTGIVASYSDPYHLADAVTLAGHGAGRVTLANVRITGVADGSWFSVSGAGIAGGGFAELHLVDCDVQPAQWDDLTGSAQGADALKVGVPYVLLERCTVTGGLSDSDSCNNPSLPDGGAGIRAPDATVAVLDSTVLGGRGPIMCYTDGVCPSLPIEDSDGGPGIVAASVLRAASHIGGGDGQPVTCGSTVIGKEDDGPPIVAATVEELYPPLSASGPAILGGPWTITWSATPPSALLLVGSPTVAPLAIGSKGQLFLDGGTMKVFLVPGGSGQSIAGTVPATPSLAGVELGAQIYDVGMQRLTRPVVAVFQP